LNVEGGGRAAGPPEMGDRRWKMGEPPKDRMRRLGKS